MTALVSRLAPIGLGLRTGAFDPEETVAPFVAGIESHLSGHSRPRDDRLVNFRRAVVYLSRGAAPRAHDRAR